MKRLLPLVGLLAACTEWGSVRAHYCENHRSQPECQQGNPGGGNGGNGGFGGNGGGFGTGGGGTTNLPYDGGVLGRVQWAKLISSSGADDVRDLRLSPDGRRLALAGVIAGTAELNGKVITVANRSGYVVRLDTAAGATVDYTLFQATGGSQVCLAFHTAWVDGGLLATGLCDGTTRSISWEDGGSQQQTPTTTFDSFIVRRGDDGGLAYQGITTGFADQTSIEGLAGDPGGDSWYLLLQTRSEGSPWAQSDAGGPLVVKLDVETLAPTPFGFMTCELLDGGGPINPAEGPNAWGRALGARGNEVFSVLRWSDAFCGFHPAGGFASSRSAGPPQRSIEFMSDLSSDGLQQIGSIGEQSTNPAVHFSVVPTGSHTAVMGGEVQGFNDFVSPNRPRTLFVARTSMTNVSSSLQLRVLQGDNDSTLSAIAVSNLETPSQTRVWAAGRVHGDLLGEDGGVVLRTVGGAPQGFLLKLNLSMQVLTRITFPVPEEVVGVAAGPSTPDPVDGGTYNDVYIAGRTETAGPFNLGGVDLDAVGGGDVVIFNVRVK